MEQLILERDLTRQQTENDTMMFQKAINQVNASLHAFKGKKNNQSYVPAVFFWQFVCK